MKKIFIAFVMLMIFIIAYFIQADFFTWFTISGIKPNIFVIYVLFIGLFAGKAIGMSSGIIFGLIIDILISRKIGITAIALGTMGFLGAYLDNNFSKESRITIMIMTFFSTIFYEIISYLLNYFINGISINYIILLKIILIETLYNTILVIIIYPIFKRFGYIIEETFKGSNILTRYF